MQTKAKISNIFLLLILLLLAFAGCKKNEEGSVASGTTGTSNSLKEITAFSFEASKNTALSSTVTATILNNAITASVPYGTDVTALIATFTYGGASLAVGSTAQTSASVTNDFTSSVIYVVTAANGSTVDYTVAVTIASSTTGNSITSFGFTQAKNSSLSADVTGTISGTAITATVDANYGFGNLIPTFVLSDNATATVSSTTQTSGTTSNDFVSSVTYRVTAQDGTTQDYTVTTTGFTTVLPDTGQTSGYTATAGEDNETTGTHQPSYTDNGDSTVTDNVTGLLWQQGDSGATTYTYTNASTYCSGLTLASKTDWRLPSKTEINQIIDAETTTSPYINTAFTGSFTAAYWSSVYSLDTANAWVTLFNGTGETTSVLQSGSYPAKCVSGSSAPAQSYTDNGDQTVTDNNTGLMWMQCIYGTSGTGCATGSSAGSSSWVTVLPVCQSATISGYSDWRLPNKNELESLIDHTSTAAPTVNATYFLNGLSTPHWTSTTFAADSTFAWVIDLSTGAVVKQSKTAIYANGRCVRGAGL